MPPYNSNQKRQIAEFVVCTEAKESSAAKYLKATGWNLPAALDSYYSTGTTASALGDNNSLTRIFDSYRDDPVDNPDLIGIERAMEYLGALNVQLDEVNCLAIAELLQCPSMGEITRKGFMDGWLKSFCDTIPKMTAHANTLRTKIQEDPELFRRVYRYTFPLSRMQGQRNLQFEIAAEQWKLFFTTEHGGVQWNTASTPWLDWWIEFLEGRGKKPVNKDLWEQVEVFMRKSREDEEFGWWSPDGAWPGALDDFVDYVKEKRKGGEMDVE